MTTEPDGLPEEGRLDVGDMVVFTTADTWPQMNGRRGVVVEIYKHGSVEVLVEGARVFIGWKGVARDLARAE